MLNLHFVPLMRQSDQFPSSRKSGKRRKYLAFSGYFLLIRSCVSSSTLARELWEKSKKRLYGEKRCAVLETTPSSAMGYARRGLGDGTPGRVDYLFVQKERVGEQNDTLPLWKSSSILVV